MFIVFGPLWLVILALVVYFMLRASSRPRPPRPPSPFWIVYRGTQPPLRMLFRPAAWDAVEAAADRFAMWTWRQPTSQLSQDSKSRAWAHALAHILIIDWDRDHGPYDENKMAEMLLTDPGLMPFIDRETTERLAREYGREAVARAEARLAAKDAQEEAQARSASSVAEQSPFARDFGAPSSAKQPDGSALPSPAEQEARLTQYQIEGIEEGYRRRRLRQQQEEKPTKSSAPTPGASTPKSSKELKFPADWKEDFGLSGKTLSIIWSPFPRPKKPSKQ